MPLDQRSGPSGIADVAPTDVVRVAVCGEASAGKSTVLNALIGACTLPDNLGADTRANIRVGWRAEPGIDLGYPDGRKETLPWPSAPDALRGASDIQIWSDRPHLRGLELLEIPMTTAEALQEAEIEAVKSCDALIWVTIASQAWRLTEKKILDKLVDARPERCVIAISRGDKLRTKADRAKLIARVRRETATYFEDAVFVHGARRLLEGAPKSSAGWARTGGPELLGKIAPALAPDAAEAEVEVKTAAKTSKDEEAAAAVEFNHQSAPSSYFGPANFVWLERGRLGGAPRPGLSQTLDHDLEALKRIGITAVITLTKEWKPPAGVFGKHGLENLFVPIPDMEPPSVEQAAQTCEIVGKLLKDGGSAVFHCHAGHGRTGTMLAAMLIWDKPDSDAAIGKVKSANKNWIQTEAQVQFLHDFARFRKEKLASAPTASGQEGDDPAKTETSRTQERQAANSGHNQKEEKTSLPSKAKEGSKMSLDKAIQGAMGNIPECLASGYVDMESGMLLGIHTVDSHPQEVLDMLAAATADLFQGPSITQIEQAFKTARGSKDDKHYFHEMLVFSENLLHVFMRSKAYPDHVIAFVCRKSANPGMALTKARMSLETITKSF